MDVNKLPSREEIDAGWKPVEDAFLDYVEAFWNEQEIWRYMAMNPKPLVDVVITTKNNVVGMAQLLMSLFYQTYPNMRLVINDESDVSILQTFQISRTLDLLSTRGIRMEYNRNLQSRGTPYAEYCAFQMVQAPYAWVVDDDNIPQPDALELLMKTMISTDAAFVQGCFGNITNSRGHANFVNTVQKLPPEGEPVFYFFDYDKDVTRSIPFGEGGNLLYVVEYLRKPEVQYSYFNRDFIEQYGNNSGIHIIVSLAVGIHGPSYLRTGSKVFHLERDNPHFAFKGMRNTIMTRFVQPLLEEFPTAKKDFFKYLGLNNK